MLYTGEETAITKLTKENPANILYITKFFGVYDIFFHYWHANVTSINIHSSLGQMAQMVVEDRAAVKPLSYRNIIIPVDACNRLKTCQLQKHQFYRSWFFSLLTNWKDDNENGFAVKWSRNTLETRIKEKTNVYGKNSLQRSFIHMLLRWNVLNL